MLGLKLKDFRDENGKFIDWTEAGPPIYYDEDNNELCAKCANDPAPATQIVAVDIHEEGPAIRCTDCGDGIESEHGYGYEEEEEESEEHPKITFIKQDGSLFKIPYDAVPIRELTNGAAVWPWDAGEYLLTYKDRLVKMYGSEEYPRRAALEDLETFWYLCQTCYEPHFTGTGKGCDHDDVICIHERIGFSFYHRACFGLSGKVLESFRDYHLSHSLHCAPGALCGECGGLLREPPKGGKE